MKIYVEDKNFKTYDLITKTDLHLLIGDAVLQIPITCHVCMRDNKKKCVCSPTEIHYSLSNVCKSKSTETCTACVARTPSFISRADRFWVWRLFDHCWCCVAWCVSCDAGWRLLMLTLPVSAAARQSPGKAWTGGHQSEPAEPNSVSSGDAWRSCREDGGEIFLFCLFSLRLAEWVIIIKLGCRWRYI